MAAIWDFMKAVSSIRIRSPGWTEQQSQSLEASSFRIKRVSTKSQSINPNDENHFIFIKITKHFIQLPHLGLYINRICERRINRFDNFIIGNSLKIFR